MNLLSDRLAGLVATRAFPWYPFFEEGGLRAADALECASLIPEPLKRSSRLVSPYLPNRPRFPMGKSYVYGHLSNKRWDGLFVLVMK
jgi:hypothetical protein